MNSAQSDVDSLAGGDSLLSNGSIKASSEGGRVCRTTRELKNSKLVAQGEGCSVTESIAFGDRPAVQLQSNSMVKGLCNYADTCVCPLCFNLFYMFVLLC